MSRDRRRICVAAQAVRALAGTLLLGSVSLPAAPAPLPPSKAAFLVKFVRYATWPADMQPRPGKPFVLCVVGRDPLGSRLDAVAAREAAGSNPIALRRLAGADGAAGCHVALVTGEDDDATAALLAALDDRPVLTVTDAAAGPARGMIHFVEAANHVRFEIDEPAAARHGIALSSRLLALGTRPRAQAR